MAESDGGHRKKRMKKTPLDDIDELEDDPDPKEESSEDDDRDYSSQDSDESDDEDPVYEGETNKNGQWHGKGTLTWPVSETKFEGHFENGVKTGLGKFTFGDGSSLEGNYVDDAINGEGKYTFSDGRIIKGTYVDGTLDGAVEESNEDGSLIFQGTYKDGTRHHGTLFYEDGGKVEGSFNAEGELHGDNVTYFYPGWYCVLKGTWKNGVMKKAKFQILQPPYPNCKVDNKETCYHYDISTATQISEQPLLADPYETITAYVAKSSIPDSGEGLFAKHDIPADRVVSFYNGVRLTLEEVDARDWTLNSNTISLQYQDDEGEDKTVIIDVPKPYDSTVHYCASLGHKVNHSSTRCNSKYDTFDHPRFGLIKCIRTLQEVKKDEEFLVTYDYEHGEDGQDVPEWYKHEVSNANK